ncbi:ABC transporter ATP-binding protein [Acidaminobacter sp. JC074]|uniref:ABC transporter ATP-binding protein n=1 Tax=Acidaminobacter sp. JC074 TaxID=2530199 RepID=UPI001F0E09A1|nr:ABC transporter ATP-binding protein [Acidaminobacter sp. JC074]
MRPGMGRGRFEKKAQKATNIRQTLKRLLTYMKKAKYTMLFVTGLVIFSSILNVLGPYFIGRAVDEYLYPKNLNGFSNLLILLACVYISGALLNWITSYLVVGVSQRTVKDIRKDLFSKLQVLPVKFFDSHNDGDLVSRLTNDVDNISNTLNQSLTQLISSLVTLVAVFVMMVFLDIRLTLVSILSIPFVIILTQTIASFTRRYFKDKMVDLGNLNAFTEENISGQKVVLAYGQEEDVIKEFMIKNDKYRKSAIKAETLTSIMGPIMNFTNNIIYALIALVGGYMVVNKMTSVGVVVIFINYSRQFSRPINQIATLYNTIQSAIAGAERVFEILDKPEELYEGDQASIEGHVHIESLDFSYEEDKPILKDINMKASKGEMIAIVGPTGAGKTTIINLLTRFYDVDRGQIKIDDKLISDIGLNELRRQLGIVLQDTYLFKGTVMDNIRYGNPDASDEDIYRASKLSNAHKFIHRLPEGYSTVLSGEGFGISQGQRQLIAIARAILADPKILILDEATSSVDTRTEKHIQEGLLNLMKGRTSFVIAHRLSTIKSADQIYVMDDGKIIEKGNHKDLMSLNGHYHDMYTTQFMVS